MAREGPGFCSLCEMVKVIDYQRVIFRVRCASASAHAPSGFAFSPCTLCSASISTAEQRKKIAFHGMEGPFHFPGTSTHRKTQRSQSMCIRQHLSSAESYDKGLIRKPGLLSAHCFQGGL